jgi:hypothetical protein
LNLGIFLKDFAKSFFTLPKPYQKTPPGVEAFPLLQSFNDLYVSENQKPFSKLPITYFTSALAFPDNWTEQLSALRLVVDKTSLTS